MDPWLHQVIALERRDRWIRAAAAAREAQGSNAEEPEGRAPAEPERRWTEAPPRPASAAPEL
jgi:hypothetical protein